MTEDKLKHAKEQGQAQYDSIRELVARLRDDSPDGDRVREDIDASALSVLVRSGWHTPGDDTGKPEEFEILLCTGGPAVRLTGTLDNYGQPDSVSMQVQDWFQPWTGFDPAADDEEEDVLLAYAQSFYFGD
jgi:hypothetical protein